MIRLAIVDDHELFRKGLISLLALEKDLTVAQEFALGRDVLGHLSDDVQIVLLDVNLPDAHGLDICRQLIAKRPSLGIVLVTMYDEAALLAFATAQPGVRVVGKEKAPNVLVDTIRALARVTRHRISRKVVQAVSLTDVEQRVLDLFRGGNSGAQIARELGVTRATVSIHLSHIRAKFGVPSNELLR